MVLKLVQIELKGDLRGNGMGGMRKQQTLGSPKNGSNILPTMITELGGRIDGGAAMRALHVRDGAGLDPCDLGRGLCLHLLTACGTEDRFTWNIESATGTKDHGDQS